MVQRQHSGFITGKPPATYPLRPCVNLRASRIFLSPFFFLQQKGMPPPQAFLLCFVTIYAARRANFII